MINNLDQINCHIFYTQPFPLYSSFNLHPIKDPISTPCLPTAALPPLLVMPDFMLSHSYFSDPRVPFSIPPQKMFYNEAPPKARYETILTITLLSLSSSSTSVPKRNFLFVSLQTAIILRLKHKYFKRDLLPYVFHSNITTYLLPIPLLKKAKAAPNLRPQFNS